MLLKGFTPEITNSEIGKLIGREIMKLENGESEVSFEMTDAWLNMQGILHGGACDHAGYGLRCSDAQLAGYGKISRSRDTGIENQLSESG